MYLPITTPQEAPVLSGPAGAAWTQDVDAAVAKTVAENPTWVPPPRELNVAAWLVCAPSAHPFWHSYAVWCVALRDVPGFPPASITLPGATHEVMVYALDPSHPLKIDEQPHLLHPVNFVGQFIEVSDEAAAARVRAAVLEIVNGTLSPDTDYRRQWVERFSASNLKPGALEPDTLILGPDGTVTAIGTGKAMADTLMSLPHPNDSTTKH